VRRISATILGFHYKGKQRDPAVDVCEWIASGLDRFIAQAENRYPLKRSGLDAVKWTEICASLGYLVTPPIDRFLLSAEVSRVTSASVCGYRLCLFVCEFVCVCLFVSLFVFVFVCEFVCVCL